MFSKTIAIDFTLLMFFAFLDIHHLIHMNLSSSSTETTVFIDTAHTHFDTKADYNTQNLL